MFGEWNRAYGSDGIPAVPVRRSAGGSRRVQARSSPTSTPRSLLVPQRVQAVRRGQPGAAELPDPGLEHLRGLSDQAAAWHEFVSRTRQAGARIRRASLHREGLAHDRRDFPRHVPADRRVDRKVRRAVDPDGVFASDMARRLELVLRNLVDRCCRQPADHSASRRHLRDRAGHRGRVPQARHPLRVVLAALPNDPLREAPSRR